MSDPVILWEYQCVTEYTGYKLLTERLNAIGALGWEVISVVSSDKKKLGATEITAIAKRRIPNG